MTYQVCGLLVGVRNVLVRKGKVDNALLEEIIKLVNFSRSIGVEPVMFANVEWSVDDQPLDQALGPRLPSVRWFFANRGNCEHKPTAAAVPSVCEQMGWNPRDVLYLGNTEADMRTAVNGGVLFLKASWYESGTSYGLEFASPMEVARFLDIFCQREYLWHFEIRDESGLEFYSLAPFSTLTRRYKSYSADARAAAKFGLGHPAYWTQALYSTVYFAQLHTRFDYVACYPGHATDSPASLMEEPFAALAGSFRKKLLPDLIVRHTTARKSQRVRRAGGRLSHLDQLNTICLNATPIRNRQTGSRYVRSPLRRGKTVLVVDDFCTQGYSLDAARLYIAQTGAQAILVSWLRTINSDYLQLMPRADVSWNPYEPQEFETLPGGTKRHPYRGTVAEDEAASEVDEKFDRFCSWSW